MAGKPWSEEYRQRRSESSKGAQNPNWRGGKRLTKGYVYIYCPNHPNATKHGAVLEHRLAMEWHLGRFLERREVIHHKNEDTLDNRIENLELLPNQARHQSGHHKGKPSHWRGKHFTDEHKAKLSATGKGRAKSEEHKQKISAGLKGKPKTKEHIEKMRRSLIEGNKKRREQASFYTR